MEMVLGNPGRIEAQALGMRDLLGGEAIALGRGRLIEQAREKSQALSWPCWWHPHIFAQAASCRCHEEARADGAALRRPAVANEFFPFVAGSHGARPCLPG